MSLSWQKQPITRELARSLRAATRRHPHIDGHTFAFNDLKEMWAADDVHVVLTHAEDKAWQYWFQAPEGGWTLTYVGTKAQAQAAAEDNTEVEGPDPGTYLMARFTPQHRWMRVRCSTKNTLAEVNGVFSRMGCETKTETVKV